MGRRRGKRHSSSATKNTNEAEKQSVSPAKKQKCFATSLHLSGDQEDRLGRLSSSLQWVIKIAQDRGSNACLALQACVRSEITKSTARLVLLTVDGQEVEIVAEGSWKTALVKICAMIGEGKLFILSGLGARVPTSGAEIIFDADKLAADLVDSSTGLLFGSFEVAKGKVVKEPTLDVIEETRIDECTASPRVTMNVEGTDTHVNPDNGLSEPLTPELDPPNPILSHAPDEETILKEGDDDRVAKSATPAWLRTPATEVRTTHTSTADDPEEVLRGNSSSIGTRSSTPKVREPQQLGTRMYTPISMVECNDRKPVNVIGLITTDHYARRSLSGTRDWKITIGLIDVEGSKDALAMASNVSFNLFAPQETDLPKGKPASVLLIQGVKIRAFNGYPQGNGYPGQFAWALMDTSEGNPRKALTCSDNCVLSDAEKKELKRQYDWYRKRHKGQIQPAKRKPTRPLISLSAVEREVFFDTTVEIVRIWSNSRPMEIYVTDYTTHPLFFAANDVYLEAFSREELAEQQEDSGDAGNGRVLPISLWDEQQNAINLIQVGMLVRLENVRPKMQPNNFLGGTMSGGSEEKLRVIIVKETKIIEDFARKKQEYLEEVASKRAERIEARRSVERDTNNKEEKGDAIQTSGSTNMSMPPPGQRPLAIIENCSDLENRTESSGKTQDSQQEEAKVPIILEESMSSMTEISLEELDQLTTEQLQEGKLYVSEGRVFDMLPRNISEIAEVICGLCKSKLPLEHSFCAKCAEEDGKDLQYRFNFALLLEPIKTSSSSLKRKIDASLPTRIALLVRGGPAQQFLHGFHPKDVRNRQSTRDRLQRRMLPLLGSKLIDGDSHGNDVNRPLPFRFAVKAHLAQKDANVLNKRFTMINTRLTNGTAQ